MTGTLSSAITSTWLNVPQHLCVSGLFGCTSVVIISMMTASATPPSKSTASMAGQAATAAPSRSRKMAVTFCPAGNGTRTADPSSMARCGVIIRILWP
jgi:hypothetical protein